MSDRIPLSQAAYDRIEAEHTELVTVWRIDIARKIETARELGDLSENGDYHAAKEEQGKVEGRIAHLANLLENAEIVESGDSDRVVPGVVVGIRFEGDDEVERYLLGSIEERADDGVTITSPGSALGKALMGAKVGDSVSYETPNGKTLTIEVASIGD